MSDRVSKTILLCEDDAHERLVRSYLKVCGLHTEPPYLIPRNASRAVHGGNVSWVLREFPRELEACRKRHATRASTLLIVVVDADQLAVDVRRAELAADPPWSSADPLVVLIPKRHVEAWIRAALGQTVNEADDYKLPELLKAEFRAAARIIHGWARDNPRPGSACIPSLKTSLPEWRKIG